MGLLLRSCLALLVLSVFGCNDRVSPTSAKKLGPVCGLFTTTFLIKNGDGEADTDFRIGERIVFEGTVINVGESKDRLSSDWRCPAVVYNVLDQHDNILWSSSNLELRDCIGVDSPRVYQPRETVTFPVAWNQMGLKEPMKEGEYRVSANFLLTSTRQNALMIDCRSSFRKVATFRLH